MSRGMLINSLDTYLGIAFYEEFLGENPSESPYEIYGTYHQKDDSTKPSFVKKMMKRSKPVLFRKYMREKMDLYIYDLHSGRLDDLKWAVWALTNEPLESEKTLIVISSVLSWGGNEHKMMEVKPKKKKPVDEENPEGGEGEEAANEEEEKDDEEEEEKKEGEEEEEKKEEPKEVKKEPKLDEEGNVIEDNDTNKKEVDEYGNEILQAQLDENGNEILPGNDDSFEYYFEDDYIEKKNKEKKEKEEAERLLHKEEKEENPPEINQEQINEGGSNDGEERKILEGSSSRENMLEDREKERSQQEEEEKEKVKKRIVKVKIIKPKVFKRIGYREKEYKKRVPISFYAHFKEYEDYLLNLKYENLNIYIVCAGIPYGGCETVFNYFFKSAWLQDPVKLPIYGDGSNIIPTIHIKDLSKIVKKLAEAKSESSYIFAIDKTKDKTLKNLISSLSINIGSGQTTPIEYNKELIRNIVLKHDDFFIDKTKYEKNKVVMNITKHELSWTRFLGIDVMLKPGKFLDEEFEWYCKEGIPKNNKKLLDEFCSFRKLRPLKIILNCKNEQMRKFYAEKLSKFYNIPTLNFELMMEKLNMNIADLTEEEVFMNDKYFKLKDQVTFIDTHPNYKNEAKELLFDKTEILFECLKYLLKSNAALNRGYVLEGIPVNLEEVDRTYYYKQEIVPEEGEVEEEKPEEEEEADEEEKEEEKNEENDQKSKEEEKKDNQNDDEAKEEGGGEPKEEGENEEKIVNEEGEEPKEGDNEEPNEEGEDEGKKEEAKKEDEEEPKQEKEGDEEVNPEEGEAGEEGNKKKKKKKKKVKKIKPKKYKTKFDKTLLPESVIDLCQVDPITKVVDNTFWEVDAFYQENNIEILNLVYEDEAKEDPEETFEMMRIYVERNGRPFNYFQLKDEDINVNRINYVEGKQKSIETDIQQKKNNLNKIEEEKEEVYWNKMKERIDFIQKDREQLSQCEKVPTRKFLLINIMPTLTKGLLEVCKINPIDPIDYLADFIFTNSTDNK